MAIGRISGPLLKANLIRDGIDLAFETDLLFLKVASPTNTTPRVGINTNNPQYDLDVNGTIRSTNLRVDNLSTIAGITINGNSLTVPTNIINFSAAAGEATIYHSRLVVDDFNIQGNVISTTVSNSPVEIRTNGTGSIQLQSNTAITGNLNVTGNINATGNITVGGNILIGDASTDTIVFNASIESDIVPITDDTFDLGSPGLQWNDIYVNNFYTTTINIPELNVGNLIFRNNEITTTAGQDININVSGTGGVRLANFRLVANTLTNVVSGAISVFEQSGTGYFNIATTNGFVPPVGTLAQRPTAYAVLGMTRYNSDARALEIWDGNTWASPAGTLGAVSEADANDIAAAFALTFG